MDSEKKNVKILRNFSYIYQKNCTSLIFASLSRKFYGQNDEKKNLFLLYPIKNKKKHFLVTKQHPGNFRQFFLQNI